jgi:sulfur carrier protein ThiS
MIVKIKLFSGLKKYAPDNGGQFELKLPEKSTVRDLLEKIGIPPDLHIVYFINGRHAEQDTSLKSGDTLIVHLAMLGG